MADAADALIQAFQKLVGSRHVSLCGGIRRQSTTVEQIEILSKQFPKGFRHSSVKKLLNIASTDEKVTTGYTHDEIPVTIYHVAEKDFAWQLLLRTGSIAHVEKIKKKLKTPGGINAEKDIYARAGLPFIPPEMREDIAEREYAKHPEPLIEMSDIRGVVHNHTTWSDGVDSLEDFVGACQERKHEYCVISDHSKNAHYARGLKEGKLARQWDAIDQLNKKMAPFRIFKSIECDILMSGELDFPASILKQFNLVIISIHQQLKMAEEKATARLIKAIENPATTILGHMTGRQLLIRPGYPVNFKKVIDACAANGIVIELNANPYRLDMDWSHIPYACKKGVMISIDPDAHSIQEIDNIRWGVVAARKGGLTKDMTWNSMDLPAISKWLRKNRRI